MELSTILNLNLLFFLGFVLLIPWFILLVLLMFPRTVPCIFIPAPVYHVPCLASRPLLLFVPDSCIASSIIVFYSIIVIYGFVLLLGFPCYVFMHRGGKRLVDSGIDLVDYARLYYFMWLLYSPDVWVPPPWECATTSGDRCIASSSIHQINLLHYDFIMLAYPLCNV